MKYLSTVIFILCFIFIACAESPAIVQQHSPQLKSLIENMQYHFEHVKALEGTFRQETFSCATKLKAIAKGRIYIQKPNKMRWDYMQPEKQAFVTNGQNAWLYIFSEKRIIINNAKRFFKSTLVRSFFSGPRNFTKYFRMHMVDSGEYKGFVLILTPKRSNIEMKNITLWVRDKDFQVEEIETQDLMGNTNKVILTNICYKETLPTNLFRLTIPMGTTVEENPN